jgi:hypothetical protein
MMPVNEELAFCVYGNQCKVDFVMFANMTLCGFHSENCGFMLMQTDTNKQSTYRDRKWERMKMSLLESGRKEDE